MWWALQLQGSFALFWLVYFISLSVGIGEAAAASFQGAPSHSPACAAACLQAVLAGPRASAVSAPPCRSPHSPPPAVYRRPAAQPLLSRHPPGRRAAVLAYAIAALSPNMDTANAALPAYVVTLLFFAGCLIRWVDIPAYWQWYAYIDVLR